MGKAIITVQMSADASIGPSIGWFEGGEQEAAGEANLKESTVFRSGVVLQNYEPVSVDT